MTVLARQAKSSVLKGVSPRLEALPPSGLWVLGYSSPG